MGDDIRFIWAAQALSDWRSVLEFWMANSPSYGQRSSLVNDTALTEIKQPFYIYSLNGPIFLCFFVIKPISETDSESSQWQM